MPPDPDSLAARITRSDALSWFEMYGALRGKKRQIIRAPEIHANIMQRDIRAIVKYCHEVQIPCRIVTLKGRQQGSSSYSVAEIVHQCRRTPTNALIIGDEYEKSVKNLVNMFTLFTRADSFDWGNTYNQPSKTFTNDSALTTETANDNRAGASGTYQAMLMTEVAHWKDTENTSSAATFAAALSCVPLAADTLVIVESTPKGVGGSYYETYQGAILLDDYIAGNIPKDWNGFFKVFYPWHNHPEYGGALYRALTDDEETEIRESLTDKEMDFLQRGFASGDPMKRLHWRRTLLNSPAFQKDEEKFEQEYPFDEDSGFLMSGRRAFSLQKIRQMRAALKDAPLPIYCTLQWADKSETSATLTPCAEDEACVVVFEKPRPGFRYIFPTDPATGASQTVGADPDNHAPLIMREGCWDNGKWFPPKLVARLADCFKEKRHPKQSVVCRWDIDVLEMRVTQLSLAYGKPTLVPEMNMDRGLCTLAVSRGTIPVYKREVFNRIEQKDESQWGWLTTTSTRPPILEALAAAIRKFGADGDGIDIPDAAVLRELESCVVTLKGRIEAMPGTHDDTVLALAIGLATIGHGSVYTRKERDRTHEAPRNRGPRTFQ